jgi:hypothetical protein
MNQQLLLNWNYFKNLPNIKDLPLWEQKRRYQLECDRVLTEMRMEQEMNKKK